MNTSNQFESLSAESEMDRLAIMTMQEGGEPSPLEREEREIDAWLAQCYDERQAWLDRTDKYADDHPEQEF